MKFPSDMDFFELLAVDSMGCFAGLDFKAAA